MENMDVHLGVISFVEGTITEVDNSTTIWMTLMLNKHGRKFKIIDMTGYVYEDKHYRSILYKI